MISFASDYTEGAHPKVLERLLTTNMEQLPGYGTDHYSEEAKQKIREATGKLEADVFFLAGGTQTNQIVIDGLLAPYEGVIAAETGHIHVHESGAVEYTGHKVLALPSHDGKLDADEVEAYLKQFFADANHEHMVFPGMVYISHPTELGTIYSREEMARLYAVCKNFNIPLFTDGARLGYGLMSLQSDMSLQEFADLCDVFYIGGTKVGALLGEAVVFSGIKPPAHFVTRIKQHGALLAKGRVLGLQFDALFTDELYGSISRHAIRMAERLKAVFVQKEIPFAWESPTNQQFVILNNDRIASLREHVDFSFWEPYDEARSIVRFATSWATTQDQIDQLEALL